jgi:uncharacterized protein (DUF427 family)
LLIYAEPAPTKGGRRTSPGPAATTSLPLVAAPARERQGVRLQVAADRGASKHFDDSRNRGIAGRPARPSPRYTVDQTTMRTFGEERVRRQVRGPDPHSRPAVVRYGSRRTTAGILGAVVELGAGARGAGERLVELTGLRPWWPMVEPSPRWIRVRVAGELVADSRRAVLHVQYGPGDLPRSFLPTYYFPADDVTTSALVEPIEPEPGLTVWTVKAGGVSVSEGAWMHRSPAAPLELLGGMVTFSWGDPLTWFEEDERLLAHARDPHKRVDVVASSRAVAVEVDNVLLAESQRPLILFETWLPVRYYLPREDVRVELVRSERTSVCPYKGAATWWHARHTDRIIEDIAWSYESPIAENPRIRGLVCFRNERVDLTVDGQRQERPLTPWS